MYTKIARYQSWKLPDTTWCSLANRSPLCSSILIQLCVSRKVKRVQQDLMNQETLQKTQGTYYSTNNKTKVISRRIICYADSPQLANTVYFSKANREKNDTQTHIATNHRPNASSKTCHALRNSVSIANSVWWCHYK